MLKRICALALLAGSAAGAIGQAVAPVQPVAPLATSVPGGTTLPGRATADARPRYAKDRNAMSRDVRGLMWRRQPGRLMRISPTGANVPR